MELHEVIPSCFRRIDHYWRSIGAILNGHGKPKYVQLYQLTKCVFPFSNGSAVPECDFNTSKKLLEAHKNSIQEEIILAIRRGFCSSTYTDYPDLEFDSIYASHFCKIDCCCYMYFEFFSVDFKILLPVKSCVILFCHSERQTSAHWWHFKVQNHKGSTRRMQYCMAHSWYAAALAKKKEEEQKGTERRKKDNERLVMGKSLALKISDLDKKNQVYNMMHTIPHYFVFVFVMHHITFLWSPNSHFYPFLYDKYESLFVFFNSVS